MRFAGTIWAYKYGEATVNGDRVSGVYITVRKRRIRWADVDVQSQFYRKNHLSIWHFNQLSILFACCNFL